MVKLIGMLSQFNPVNILVIGDLMLDIYTTGKVKRISPEAPVSVLHVQKEERRPGGAGNVVLNLISLGAQVTIVGRVGKDVAGMTLCEALKNEGANIEGVISQSDYKTPVKNRLIADSQQVLRVDFEDYIPLSESLEQTIVEEIPQLLDECRVVALSDYGKGFLTKSLLMWIIEMARAKRVPIIVDPKGDDFSKYQGANVLKPNLAEAYAASKLPPETNLEDVAQTILKNCQVDELLITRSEAGMSLFYRNGERFDFPVRSKEVKDVTGAGDTVLAVISMALANGLDIKHSAQLANIAAGMAIERIGCARINLSELAERFLELDVENKIFDEEHLFALQQSVKGKRCSVLALKSNGGMSTAVFKSIRKLKRSSAQKLIIYIRDLQPDEEFISLLSSLSEVDFILLKCKDLKNLNEILRPDEFFEVEGNKLTPIEVLQPLNSQI
ncbi:MAG: D-glycero-beta-D-manno-heptose-7-phosphate kinase [Chlamydiae bacterium]|nr:D-glycero-beta-D-manno-heptose-7-phosphate kinase [Chlamydiota bacterium]